MQRTPDSKVDRGEAAGHRRVRHQDHRARRGDLRQVRPLISVRPSCLLLLLRAAIAPRRLCD